MTPPTHNKEWTEGYKNQTHTEFYNDRENVSIDNTLLDQLRRDAKKELLDEIGGEFDSISDGYFIKTEVWKKIKSKTLGGK